MPVEGTDDFLPPLAYVSSVSVSADAVSRPKQDGKAEHHRGTRIGQDPKTLPVIPPRSVGEGVLALPAGRENRCAVNSVPRAF